MPAMKPISPYGVANKGGEYKSDMATPSTVPSTIPSTSNHKDSMMDGPYGGKKPQS